MKDLAQVLIFVSPTVTWWHLSIHFVLQIEQPAAERGLGTSTSVAESGGAGEHVIPRDFQEEVDDLLRRRLLSAAVLPRSPSVLDLKKLLFFESERAVGKTKSENETRRCGRR